MTKTIADRAWLGIAGGITLFLSAIFVGQLVKAFVPHDTPDTIQTITATIAVLTPFFLLFTSAIAFVRGCCLYAKAHEYSPWLGFMVGLLPFVLCFGVVVYIYLRQPTIPRGAHINPNSWRQESEARDQRSEVRSQAPEIGHR